MINLLGEKWKQDKPKFLRPDDFESDQTFFQAVLYSSSFSQFYPAISFPMKEPGQLGKIIMGEDKGDFYARSGTKIRRELEVLLVLAEAEYVDEYFEDLEPTGYLSAAVFPSGMSAIDTVMREIARNIPIGERKGKRVLQGKTVYTFTNNVLSDRMQEYGLESALKVDTSKPEEVRKALQENKGNIIALFYEAVTNPLIEYTDTRAIAEIAKEFGVPVIVDNTFLTPYLQQPFRMGADIVIHSMTKYMNGYGDMLAGAVIGPKEFVESLKNLQIASGPVTQSPGAEALLYSRLQDLPRRMEEHIKNAQQFAEFLRQCPNIAEVYYPNLGTATRYGSPGAVITFVLAGNSDEERTARESELMNRIARDSQYQRRYRGVERIRYQVSLGEEQHLMIGETTLGLPSDCRPGTVRFAVGRSPKAQEVMPYLEDVLVDICQR